MDILDRVAKETNSTRSWIITSAIESYVMDRKWMLGKDEDVVGGAIVILYETGHMEAEASIDRVQHEYLDQIRATMHVHLTRDLCLEVIAIKGKLRDIKELAQKIEGKKGILAVKYNIHPLSE